MEEDQHVRQHVTAVPLRESEEGGEGVQHYCCDPKGWSGVLLNLRRIIDEVEFLETG